MLEDILDSNDKVLILFTAPDWCVPCQRLAPHFEAAATAATDTVFVYVDIDKAHDIKNIYDVMSVPTMEFYVNGVLKSDVAARTSISILKAIE